MRELYSPWLDGFEFSGDVKADALRLLLHHDLPHVAEHSQRVSKEARRLAEQFGANPDDAEVAGLLHDISAITSLFERNQRGIERLSFDRRLRLHPVFVEPAGKVARRPSLA